MRVEVKEWKTLTYHLHPSPVSLLRTGTSHDGQSPSAQQSLVKHFPGRDLALYHCLSLSVGSRANYGLCAYYEAVLRPAGSVAVRLLSW